MAEPNPIILYDGVCGLCNRLNQFTLRRDKRGVFRFAALQSEFARALLKPHGANAEDLDTFYVVLGKETPQERLLARSRAALYVLGTIGGPWKLLTILGLLPTFILDFLYRVIARNRYSMFGRHDHCLPPDPNWKDRFIATE
ncbi:MAG: DUF393 domain-containing protein [Acidobacteria bacterium]|nr:DUF393 domain-containing protein [Acidobacteriota bacterium]